MKHKHLAEFDFVGRLERMFEEAGCTEDRDHDRPERLLAANERE
jgi:hypothetical protein